MTTLAIMAHLNTRSAATLTGGVGTPIPAYADVVKKGDGYVLQTSPSVQTTDRAWFSANAQQDKPANGFAGFQSNVSKLTLPENTCAVSLRVAGGTSMGALEMFGVHISNQNFDLLNVAMPIDANDLDVEEHSWKAGLMAAMRLFPHKRLITAATGNNDDDGYLLNAAGEKISDDYYMMTMLDWGNSDATPDADQFATQYGHDLRMDSGGWADATGAPVRGSVPLIISQRNDHPYPYPTVPMDGLSVPVRSVSCEQQYLYIQYKAAT